ncbi:MAG: TonB-dependent receptor [Verrucomicrobiae bacterium]|nr:TonB-dependent receptor [Verrucomicrobiae bacterium]NNJ41919.1 TonB-dependent receptor [Akkermansiaceae bacterium]
MKSTIVIAFTAGSFSLMADQLPETVISANRTEELIKNTPYSVAVIGEDELLDGAIRTLPEAIKNTPGVMIQKTTHGHGSPYIRGFTGRQNLLLVDGIRINNATFRSGPVQYWNTVDSQAIERLELVKGQGSVLYGSDAIGGTLNTLTRSSNFNEYDVGWFADHSLSYRFDTNSRSQVGRIESAFGQGGKWGILLGITSKDFGDIKDSAVGHMKNTGYDELDMDFRFDYAVSSDTTMTLAHQSIDQDGVWRWHSTIFNPGWRHDGHVATPGKYNARVYDQERSLTYLKLAGGEGVGWLKNWSATLSYQKSQDSQFQDRSLTDIRTQSIDVETWGLGLQMESDLGAGSLLYGLDYYHDDVNASGTRTGKDPRSQRPVADDSAYDLLGLYAQYKWNPIARLPKLETSLGIRYTYADAYLGKNYDTTLDADLSTDKQWRNWVVSGRALYDLNDCWNIYAGISQGFRAPNLNDLSGNLTTRSGLSSLGSLDLDPEKFLSYEMGVRYEVDHVSLAVSAYWTDIESVIMGVPIAAGSKTQVTTNGQDGQVYGVEAEAIWDVNDRWRLLGQASWQEGDTRSSSFIGGPRTEDYISRLAPLMGSMALRWTHPDETFWIEGRVTAAAKADKLSARDQGDTQRIPSGGTPMYVIASLYAGWQATDDLLLTLGLENLTDEDYRIHGSGQNEAGINAILGAKLTF